MGENKSGFVGMTNATKSDATERGNQILKNSDSPFHDGVEFEIDLSADPVKGEWVEGRSNGDDLNGFGYQQAIYRDGTRGDHLSVVFWVKIFIGSIVGIVPMFKSMLTRKSYDDELKDRSADGEFVNLVKQALNENTGKTENEANTAVVRKVKGTRWRIKSELYKTTNYSGGHVIRQQFHINKAD